MKRKNRRVVLTHHCVGRFHERFRPALHQVRARRELEMLVNFGELDPEPPEWLAGRMYEASDAYLIVGEDLVLPLAGDADPAVGERRLFQLPAP